MAYTAYMTFNGVDETTYNLRVKNIVRPVLPPINNRFVQVGATDGSYYFGANVGNREIEVTFEMVEETSKADMQTLIPQIANWLFPEDRQAKVLTFTDEEYFYTAQVAGDVAFNEIFLYGDFTITFICTDPYKYKDEEDNTVFTAFERDSNGQDASFTTISSDLPRYGYGGIMIEREATNIINNSTFTNPISGIPLYWSAKTGNDAGVVATNNNVVTLETPSTWATSTSYYGIVETPGNQHFALSTTARWSVGVWVRTTGDAYFRASMDALDSTFSPLPTQYSDVLQSEEWTYFKWEYRNITSQYVLGVGFEAYANGSGSTTGRVEIKYPNFEIADYYGSGIGAPMAHETIFNPTFGSTTTRSVDNLQIPNLSSLIDTSSSSYGIGITIKPFFGRGDAQSLLFDKDVFTVYQDGNNYLRIYHYATTRVWRIIIVLNGSGYTGDVAHTDFDRLDTLMLYFQRNTKSSYTLYTSINGEMNSQSITTPAQDFFPTKMFIGQTLTNTNQFNGVFSNLVFDSTPDHGGYFVSGASAQNEINNPTFSEGSDGFDNWLQIGFTGISTLNNVFRGIGTGANKNPYIYQTHAITSGDTVFYYVRAKVTNSDCEELFIQHDGDRVAEIVAPVQDQWYELYAKRVKGTGSDIFTIRMEYFDTTTAQNKEMQVDGLAGNGQGVQVYNMTSLGIESYSEEQMLEIARGTATFEYEENFLGEDTLDITNYSLSATQYPVITIQYDSADSNLLLTEEYSGNIIRLYDSYSAGDVVVIDNLNKTVTKNDEDALDTLDFANSTWLSIGRYHSLLLSTHSAQISGVYTEKVL